MQGLDFDLPVDHLASSSRDETSLTFRGIVRDDRGALFGEMTDSVVSNHVDPGVVGRLLTPMLCMLVVMEEIERGPAKEDDVPCTRMKIG